MESGKWKRVFPKKIGLHMPAATDSVTAGLSSNKFAATSMEPALQSKKQVEPPFLKTVPAKNDFDGVPLQSRKHVPSPSQKPTPSEPIMQAKKRNHTDFTKTELFKPSNISMDTVNLQSKKRVETPGENKPIQSEPPLQSKRRTPGIQTSMMNGFHDDHGHAADDFMLLGNQDKFSQNVKYKVKPSTYSRDISPPKQMKLQLKENRDPSPSRAPVVNTSQFRQPSTPLAPQRPKVQTEQKQEPAKSSVPQEPKVSKEPKVTISPKRVEQEVRQSRIKDDEAKNLNQAGPVKESQKDKRIEHMNEFAQTNMEKGVADSALEAPSDYALRYKTGISAPRPTKKISEYQKQFQWRSGPPASPLLKAEQDMGPKQVVYNNNPQLSPPKKSVVPKETEYQKQFRAFKLVPVPKEEPAEMPPRKIGKLMKSKSMEDLSPAEIRPAGSAPVVGPNNKRLTQETDQKAPELAPEVPRKKNRQYRSEYNSNYRSPTRFDYVRGSWHGAAPPQLKMSLPEESTRGPVLSNWFAEVIELRRKAQEYRQRALGTHFSREHLVQLMAKQNDLWEASTSTARSTLSALSLESGLNTHKAGAQRLAEVERGPTNRAPREGGSNAATMASEDEGSTGRLSVLEEGADVAPPKRQAWAEVAGQEETGKQTPSSFSDRDESPARPAKVGAQLVSTGNQRPRHHLDRTTPSQDGALIGSSETAKPKRTGKKMVSKSLDSGSVGDNPTPREETPVEHQPLAGQRTYTAFQGDISASPTLGLATRDYHALRDDSASTDRPLVTKYVENRARPRLTPGLLSAIDERFGNTYNKPSQWEGLNVPQAHAEEDVLSTSLQSIASSISLASDTLERARKRKEFWGKK
ncbi:nuclear protein MDM1-like isoform X6 [Dreissena polymorpha]|uniref:nuclear protein MDM1-like isoform X6 n=2 Tax=Dreissena polymorpha TaxID=45954 RepID=UPI002263D6C5|nr:nuclear protein MDM1-like isoform X6 [Dreissena polymorpha]